jgi:hypothetical protein
MDVLIVSAEHSMSDHKNRESQHRPVLFQRALSRVDAQDAYNSVVAWCRRTTALGVLLRAGLLLGRNLPH